MSTAGPSVGRLPARLAPYGLMAVLAGVCFSAAMAAVHVPILVVAGAASAALIGVVAWRPALAAYLYLGLFPLLAGIDRGRLIPGARPAEAWQLVLTVGAVTGVMIRFVWHGAQPRLHLLKVDVAFGALVLAGTLWPLTWLAARGRVPAVSDAMATLPILRYFALYGLVRLVIRTVDQLRAAVVVSFAAASAIALIAVGQSLRLGPVTKILGLLWMSNLNPSEVANGRASTTFSSPIASATYLSLHAGLALAILVAGRSHRPLAAFAGGVVAIGAVATGQVSAVIALAVLLAVIGRLTGRSMWLAGRVFPVAVICGLFAWPALQRRLGDIGGSGLPESWAVRIDNIRTLFLPRLRGWRWVLGVEPEAVATPLDRGRRVAYLESGYLWMLFVGGVPLVAAYLMFVRTAVRGLRSLLVETPSLHNAVVISAIASILAIVVLNLTDAHLTFRGGADITFTLAALAFGAAGLNSRAIALSPPQAQQPALASKVPT